MCLMPIAPYGSWKSPISSELIVAQSIGLSEVRIDRGDVYWLESRPQERGRVVVVRAGRDLTPPPFNVRTRVHEYGGGAWTVANGALYFSNDADRRLYLLDDGASEPMPLTPEGSWRYGDGVVDWAAGLATSKRVSATRVHRGIRFVSGRADRLELLVVKQPQQRRNPDGYF
jgi:hypothetical protein